MRQRVFRCLFALSAVLAMAFPVFADDAAPAPDSAAAEKGPAVNNEKPRAEVVFVLDSTGSMSGLIEGAKQKIWSSATSIISPDPAP